jgi:hypothetical protein
MTQRIQRHPYLALFDGPDTNNSTDARTDATVPLQALFLMNNPFVTQQAQGLARRIRSTFSEERPRIQWAHQLCWNRPALPEEVARAVVFLERFRQEWIQSRAPIEEADQEAWTSLARVLLSANEFVYVD